MTKILSNLKRIKALPSKPKRVGRGAGSGKGSHTTGKGHKGQNARSGGKQPIWFEGGQIPFVRKMPFKGGFTNHNAKKVLSYNLSDVLESAGKVDTITPDVLMNSGLIAGVKFDSIKILGRGEISNKINFEGFEYSEKAKAKIEKAGGTAK